jgi:hypothetical protein
LGCSLVDFIALHDLLNFLETSRTENGCKQRHDGVALRDIHFLHADAAAGDHCGRKVRPAFALLLVVERIHHGLPLLLIERHEE